MKNKLLILIAIFTLNLSATAIGRISDIPYFLIDYNVESIDNNLWKITLRNVPIPVKFSINNKTSWFSYLDGYQFYNQNQVQNFPSRFNFLFGDDLFPYIDVIPARKSTKEYYFQMTGSMGNETQDPMISGYNDDNSKLNVDRKGVIYEFHTGTNQTNYSLSSNIVLGGVHKTDVEEFERVKFSNTEIRGRWDYYYYDINFQNTFLEIRTRYGNDEAYFFFHPILAAEIPMNRIQKSLSFYFNYEGWNIAHKSNIETYDEYSPINPLQVDFIDQIHKFQLDKNISLLSKSFNYKANFNAYIFDDSKDDYTLTTFENSLSTVFDIEDDTLRVGLCMQFEDEIGLMKSINLNYSTDHLYSIRYFYTEKHPFDIDHQTYLRSQNIDFYQHENFQSSGKISSQNTHFFELNIEKRFDYLTFTTSPSGNYTDNFIVTDYNYFYEDKLYSNPVTYWNEYGANFGLKNKIELDFDRLNFQFLHYTHLYDNGSDIFAQFIRSKRPSWGISCQYDPFDDLRFELNFSHKPCENFYEYRNVNHIPLEYAGNVNYIEPYVKARDILSAKVSKSFFYDILLVGFNFEHLLNETEPFHPYGVRRDMTIWVTFDMLLEYDLFNE